MQRSLEAQPALRQPVDTLEPDICVLGAGSGGLSVAAAVAAFGRSVVLVEKHKMGGDCLNYGCVPSKALIAAARRAHQMRTAAPFGIAAVEPSVDFAQLRAHVQNVIAKIEPNDSAARFQGLGVRVIHAAARFVDGRTVIAGEHRILARRFVVATGSAPAVPPIPGLAEVPYFTNETIFNNADRIERLVVLGGGPIGLELAQAFRRLGSHVTVVEAATALAKDDPELTRLVKDRLMAEGVEILESTRAEQVSGTAGQIIVTTSADGQRRELPASHLLVATGRRPNVGELGLEAAGIKFDKKGIEVDAGLVTSNRRVFAVGDCIGQHQFTHAANYHAGIVVRRALFRLPAKVDPRLMPWVTFTDPELAHVGLTEQQAVEQGLAPRVLRWSFAENDRAQAERATEGHVKAIVDPKGRILGASIVGDQAGELIQMWALAISQGLKIKAMTEYISPYPTLAEVNKRAAYRFYAGAPGHPLVRKAVGLLARLG